MSTSHKSVYFPNLNGVRFIAAFLVLIHHIEQIKHLLGYKNNYYGFIEDNMGRLGVGLFFVLSGFLITYLLLNEKGQTGKINTRNFYMRRILKIWPLYFIIFLLSFFVFPFIPLLKEIYNDFNLFDDNFYYRLLLFAFFLPNIAIILFNAPYLCLQTWSIGVEEQFYAIWPWIVGSKNPLKALGKVVIVFGGVFLLFYLIIFKGHVFSLQIQDLIAIKAKHFFSQFRISVMIIGAAGAYIVYYEKKSFLNIIYRKDMQYFIYCILLICLILNVHFYNFNLEFYGLFFCFFIVNVATNTLSIINLNFSFANYLGKISYGIYIYHTTIVLIVVKITKKYLNPELSYTLFNIIIYTASITLTIIICHFSYLFIEEPLLRIKEKFSR